MFDEYARPGKCDVCGQETQVVVCSSMFGATSYAYCKHCFDNYLEPYHAMVSYIACAGLFPDDINEEYQKICRNILHGLGISEEKFIKDVEDTYNDFNECVRYMEEKYQENLEEEFDWPMDT